MSLRGQLSVKFLLITLQIFDFKHRTTWRLTLSRKYFEMYPYTE